MDTEHAGLTGTAREHDVRFGLDSPEPDASGLEAKVRSHFETLDRLSNNLKGLGMDDVEIDGHVTGILDNYQHELEQAIERLSADHPPAPFPHTQHVTNNL